jgi:hypothetical protein
MLQNSSERDPMGSTSFEVSEDLAFKVANLEMRVAAWEAAASNTLQVPGVSGGIVASRVAAFESTALSDATNVKAGQWRSRFSTSTRAGSPCQKGDTPIKDSFTIDFHQQLQEATQVESVLRENITRSVADLLRLESEISGHESRIAGLEGVVNSVGEGISRLTALLGVKERKIGELDIKVRSGIEKADSLSKDVEVHLQNVTLLWENLEKVQSRSSGLADLMENANRQNDSEPMMQAIREMQDFVMQEREVHAQDFQEAMNSIAERTRQCFQQIWTEQSQNALQFSSGIQKENEKLRQHLSESQLREQEQERRVGQLEVRLSGILQAIEGQRTPSACCGIAGEERSQNNPVQVSNPGVQATLPCSGLSTGAPSTRSNVSLRSHSPTHVRVPRRAASIEPKGGASPPLSGASTGRTLGKSRSVRTLEDSAVLLKHTGSFVPLAKSMASPPPPTSCGVSDSVLRGRHSPALPPRSPWANQRAVIPAVAIN